MKKKSVFIVIIVFVFTLTTYAQTQLPNPDFENWDSEYNATDWNSIDILFFHSAARTTDAAFNDYGVRLTTQDVIGMGAVQGVMLLGEVNLETFMPEGGIEFNDRPTGISFHYKYSPAGEDGMFMFLILTKWNEDEEKTDTIGATLFNSNELVDEYTKVSLPIVYISEEIPDTINVGFVSSGMTPEIGSELLIDSITMEYGLLVVPTMCFDADAITPTGFTANWFPVPNANSYFIDVSENEDFSTFVEGYENLELTDLGFEPFYEITGLPTNRYYYQIRVNYGDGQVSANSNVVKVPLPTVTETATNNTDVSFTANWTEVSTAINYFIDVATDDQFTNFASNYEDYSVGEQVNTAEVVDLNVNTSYFYQVRVEYSDCISQNSNTEETSTLQTGVSNLQNNFNIYSKTNKIIINNNFTEISNFEIYDNSGKMIYKGIIDNNIVEIELNNSGIYIVKINYDNKIISSKIFLQK